MSPQSLSDDGVAVPLVSPLVDVGQVVAVSRLTVEDWPVLRLEGIPDSGILDHDSGTVERVRSEPTLLIADRSSE